MDSRRGPDRGGLNPHPTLRLGPGKAGRPVIPKGVDTHEKTHVGARDVRVHDAYSYERAGLVSSAYPRSHHRGAPPRLRRLLGLREHRSDPKPRRETWPWDRGKTRQHRDAHPAPDSKSHPHAPSRQSSPTFQHLPSPTFSNSGRANVHSTTPTLCIFRSARAFPAAPRRPRRTYSQYTPTLALGFRFPPG